ncbi:MAG: efflux RND transporter periplasmic adaptor subunit [Pseudomonadota bacterium]
MRKRMTITIILLILVFGGVFGWDALRAYFIKQFFASFKPPPAAVTTTVAKAKTWQPDIEAVGSLQAIQGVNITSEQAGKVTGIFFKSGQYVHKGDLLVSLNDNVEQADLKNYTAAYNLAKLNYQRLASLLKKNAASKSEVDKNEADMKQAQAQLERVRAIIAQKNIRAPFDGKLGIRMINLGEYISPGTNMVTLQSVNPIFVEFYLPEQYITSLYVNQPIQLHVQPYPNQVFKGKITALNAEVDTQTHNILVQATVPNSNKKLYPGLFADIKILLPQQDHVITLPQTAISYSLFGDSIFVVKQTGKDKKGKPILEVARHSVDLGRSRGNLVAIKSGIKPGDVVVTSGQLKLENGSHVVINNDVKM